MPNENRETLEDWRQSLKASGYLGNTVNARLSAINGLLRYCGARDLCVTYERVQQEKDLPELTRPEYLDLLSAASRMGKEREYFLTKVFGGIGLNIGDLDCLTVESVREGVIKLPDGKEKPVPDSLKNEFLSYAAHRGDQNRALICDWIRKGITSLQYNKCNPSACEGSGNGAGKMQSARIEPDVPNNPKRTDG